MHTIKLNVQDNVFEKVIYLLQNLLKNEVEIVENKIIDDWSNLEPIIDEGLTSVVSPKSHEEIVNNIKRKYA